jgi:hypothetical protein
MSRSEKKLFIYIAIILGALFVLFISGTGLLYLFSERSIDPALAESVRNEYSVPIDVEIINTSEGNVAFIIPGEVKWDSEHKKLLYNLSDPREATLAIIETLAKHDIQAFGLLLDPASKEEWARQGKNETQVLDALLLQWVFRDVNKPYAFEFGSETNLNSGRATVLIKNDSGDFQLELILQPDGTWKIKY